MAALKTEAELNKNEKDEEVKIEGLVENDDEAIKKKKKKKKKKKPSSNFALLFVSLL